MNEISEKVSVPIDWLVDGRTPWEVFQDRKFLGNSRLAHCSTILKTDQVKKFLTDVPIDEPLVLGMDYSELDRIERAKKVWAPRPVISLLNELRVTRPQYKDYLSEYDIRQPRLYDMGFPHNNCGGFCVKAGLKQFATLLETMPDRFQHHEDAMTAVLAHIGPTARPFLQWTQKGVKYYLTLTEFKEKYRSGELKADPFDYGGCGCFTD